MGRYF